MKKIHLRKDVEPLPGGRWESNHMFEIVKCPNRYCPTNRSAA
jgi:hypothetical protein